MEIEVPAAAISSSRSLQTASYIYMSMATLLTYSYVCSLHDEWTFLVRSRWTKVKGLYIVTRCVPFLLSIGHLYMNLSPYENPSKCQLINDICSCFSFISIVCSESFFILRIYALWNNNKVVLAVMLVTSLAFGMASVIVLFLIDDVAPFKTSAIPGVTGCYQPSNNVEVFLPFILLCVLELGLMILTLIRAMQTWRGARNTLFVVLMRHNVLYYACGLFFSVLNILIPLLLNDAYTNMFQDFEVVILAILATHMHLYLWHIDRTIHDSNNVALAPLYNSDW